MQDYIIGIDTGGTCTDAALIESLNGSVIVTAKVPTTHYRLSDGIAGALTLLFEKSAIPPGLIRTVCISTTLATNCVVENRGARVGLFVIGYVKHFKLPVTAVIYLNGGHTIHGTEEEPLDLEKLVKSVEMLKGEVDAYAVTSSMSMNNPTHELVAEKAISMIDPKPVFCSHHASDQAGMHQRAATAALHAKLMPVMQGFISGVSEAMGASGLSCPLKIITGNGRDIGPETATRQAGATVASGPACTALFGASQTDETALVVDVGGTTTDIAMIENRHPVLAPDGCTIDSWETHMPSVDMHTGGIGGDSLTVLRQDGSLAIGPLRVIPLALSHETPDPATWIGGGLDSRCIFAEPEAADRLWSGDPVLSCLLENGPVTSDFLRKRTGLSGIPLDKELERLGRTQLIRTTGFTPTDALHVLGRSTFGDAARAASGATVLAQEAGMDVEAFCRLILEQTEQQITNLIIGYAARRLWGSSLAPLLSSRREDHILRVEFSLKIPLIGIGAAARSFLPGVADKLATTVSFPTHCEVGNAIGAAITTLHHHLAV